MQGCRSRAPAVSTLEDIPGKSLTMPDAAIAETTRSLTGLGAASRAWRFFKDGVQNTQASKQTPVSLC